MSGPELADALFGTYYGLDWASMAFGFVGAWLIGNRMTLGHLLTIVSVALALVTVFIAGQYGFLVANVIAIGISTRNFFKWRSENLLTSESTRRK